jgi:hypothetical protein
MSGDLAPSPSKAFRNSPGVSATAMTCCDSIARYLPQCASTRRSKFATNQSKLADGACAGKPVTVPGSPSSVFTDSSPYGHYTSYPPRGTLPLPESFTLAAGALESASRRFRVARALPRAMGVNVTGSETFAPGAMMSSVTGLEV